MKRKMIVLVALGLVAGLGYAGLKFFGNGSPTAQVAAATTQVQRGPIRLSISSTGTVVSNLDVEIKCKASGEIVTLPFDISDHVDKGDLLVELDPVDEQRTVRQAEVSLASSKAKLEQARRNLQTAEMDVKNSRNEAVSTIRSAEVQAKDKRDKANRMLELREKKYASQEECETAETEAVAAEESLKSARIRLEEVAVEEKSIEVKRQDVVLAECQVESDSIALDNANQRLEYTKVYAPMAGVVSERYVQTGQIISSPTSNVGGGTELMILSDLSRVFVEAAVDESDIGQIDVGQPAEVTVDAFPQDMFKGEVVRIATKGENESNVVTFEVKVEVLGDDKEKLKPEMTANVDILVAENESALLLPSECVIKRGPEQFVHLPAVPGAGPPERVSVQVGIDDGVHVEIVSGLQEGATIEVPEGATGAWSKEGEDEQRRGGPMMMGPMGGGPPPGR